MGARAFQLPVTARWWMTAVFVGIAFSAIVRRFFPDVMPWSAELPDRTQAVLHLLAGIVVGVVLQAAWWVARKTLRPE